MKAGLIIAGLKVIVCILGALMALGSFTFALSPFWSHSVMHFLRELRYADGGPVDIFYLFGIVIGGIILTVIGIAIAVAPYAPAEAPEEK